MKRLLILGALLCVSAGAAHAEMISISKARIGDWSVEESEDGLTSERRWLAVAGGDGAGGFLIVKCDPGYNGVYVQALFPKYLGGDFDMRDFTYRIDSTPPVTDQWEYEKYSALLMDKDKAWKFSKAIRDGKVLRMRGITFEFESRDAKISIAGARDALKKVYAGCKDTRWQD